MKCVGRQAIKPQNPSFEGSDASFAGSLVCRLSLTARSVRETAKRGIPQLRYIYRDCGIYSVFSFFGLYFRFSMSSRGWFSCLACFHGWKNRTKSDVFQSHQSLLPVLILENINSALFRRAILKMKVPRSLEMAIPNAYKLLYINHLNFTKIP